MQGRLNAVKENQAMYRNQICTLKSAIEAEKAGRLESARLRWFTLQLINDNYGPWYLGQAIKSAQEISSAETRPRSFRKRTRCIWRFESCQSWRIETSSFSRQRGGMPLDRFVFVSFRVWWSTELRDAQIITGCYLDILQDKVGLVWMTSVNTLA